MLVKPVRNRSRSSGPRGAGLSAAAGSDGTRRGLTQCTFRRSVRERHGRERNQSVAHGADHQRSVKAQQFDQKKWQNCPRHRADNVCCVEIAEGERRLPRQCLPDRAHRHRNGCAHQRAPWNQRPAEPQTGNTVVAQGRGQAQVFQNAPSPGKFVGHDDSRNANQQFNDCVETQRWRPNMLTSTQPFATRPRTQAHSRHKHRKNNRHHGGGHAELRHRKAQPH